MLCAAMGNLLNDDTHSSDPQLVARAREGEQDAFVALVRRHDAAMRRLAARLLPVSEGLDLDDVLQEAYLKAYRSLDRFREESRFSTWLYRVTYNACLDELRRSRLRPVAQDPASPEWPVRSDGGIGGDREAIDALRSAVATLPSDQRAVLVLVIGEQMDHRSAAKILGVAPGTVASRLSRARAELRRQLEEVGDGCR